MIEGGVVWGIGVDHLSLNFQVGQMQNPCQKDYLLYNQYIFTLKHGIILIIISIKWSSLSISSMQTLPLTELPGQGIKEHHKLSHMARVVDGDCVRVTKDCPINGLL